MRKKETNTKMDILIRCAADSAYVWGLTAGISMGMLFNVSIRWLLVLALACVFTVALITYNRITVAVFAALAVITCALVFILERGDPMFALLRTDLHNLITGVVRYLTGYERTRPAYEQAVCIVGVVIFTSLSGVAGRNRVGVCVLLCVAAAVFGVCAYTGSLHAAPLGVCMAGLFTRFALAVASTAPYRMPHARRSFDAYIFVAVPIIAACLLGACLLPIKTGSRAFALRETISQPLDRFSDVLYPFFSPKYYDFRNTGYVVGKDRLGGSIRPSGRTVMEVAADAPLLLMGAYKDIYTGYSWLDSGIDEPVLFPENDRAPEALLEWAFNNIAYSQDIGEMREIASIFENSERLLGTYFNARCPYIKDGVFTVEMQLSVYPKRQAVITMKEASTFSLFAPCMTYDIQAPGANDTVTAYNGSLTSDGLINVNTPYTVAYRVDPSETVIYWLYLKKASKRGLYQELLDTMNKLHERYTFDKCQISVNLDESRDDEPGSLHMLNIYPAGAPYFDPDNAIAYEDFLSDTLIPRADAIAERYTVLPAHFPERVRQLAEDITKDMDNDYYKALALQLFLHQFPYTLTPGDVPPDRDFVDYFLFDGQTGYCTYFASAFVTMCRAIGLPARYVEGYAMPGTPNEDGVYIVTNRDAHAWAEVYFEGFGWEVFDPSPAVDSEGAIMDYSTLSEAYPATPGTLSITFTEASLDTEESATVPPDVVLSEIDTNTNTSNARIAQTGTLILRNIPAALLILVFIAAVWILLRVRTEERKEKSLRNLNGNQAGEAYFGRIEILLAQLGVVINEHETYYQAMKRAASVYPVDGMPLAPQEMAALFSRAGYGSEPLTEQEVRAIRHTATILEAAVREKSGVLRYFYSKYIRGWK